MNLHRWFCAALAATAASGVVTAPATDAPVGPRVPPRMLRAPGGYEDCQAQTGQALGPEEKVSARLTVASDGSLDKISLPESTPDWMAELTACVLRRTEFRAALRGGSAVESTANLFITFAAGATGALTVRVDKVGPLITPPALHRDDRQFLGCHPVGVNLTEANARQVVLVTILPDGSKGGFKLPAGAPEWLEGSALCVLSQIGFSAGTRDGQPVTSEATLPIVFADFGMESKPEYRLTAPKLSSTEEEIEAAYRTCYPPELQTQLKFTPLLRGSRRVASTVTWPLWVRPPRNP